VFDQVLWVGCFWRMGAFEGLPMTQPSVRVRADEGFE
jgi:hypothetical protein